MLYLLPLVLALTGLAFYGVLGGADFGAGFWDLAAGRGPEADRMRERVHASMAPIWEANHVWLIFVLTVMWTAYPVAFGSMASTLSLALLVAGAGILFRGAAYALRTGAVGRREERLIDTAFGLSCVLTPFALGAAAGGIASARVPVGNASGSLISSWLNPTSILVGVLAVLTGAYLAAVFLCGDSTRAGERELADRFRLRGLVMGVLAGGVALGGFFVLHSDARPIFHQLLAGRALPALVASALAGTTTLALVWLRRYEPARYTACVAVAAIVAGWALAQSPYLLPGLTARQAAASHDTEVSVVVAVIAGGAILFPSLLTLFRLTLGGRLTSGGPHSASGGPHSPASGGPHSLAPAPAAGGAAAAHAAIAPHPERLTRTAIALLVAGIGLTNAADAEWAHVLGAACLLAFIAAAFRRLVIPPATSS